MTRPVVSEQGGAGSGAVRLPAPQPSAQSGIDAPPAPTAPVSPASLTHQEAPLPPDVERAYVKYMRDHQGDLSDVGGLAATMFNAGHRIGSRSTFEAMRSVGDLLPILHGLRHKLDTIISAFEPEPEVRP